MTLTRKTENEKGTDARRTELNAPAGRRPAVTPPGARVCFARKKAARYSR